jgi:hypothetical protein
VLRPSGRRVEERDSSVVIPLLAWRPVAVELRPVHVADRPGPASTQDPVPGAGDQPGVAVLVEVLVDEELYDRAGQGGSGSGCESRASLSPPCSTMMRHDGRSVSCLGGGVAFGG